MRVLVLIDEDLATREHMLLTRLEIGLASDGATVVHAVPRGCTADMTGAFSSTLVRYDEASLMVGRAARVQQMLSSAAEQLDIPELKVDVVHVFGERAWAMGLEASRRTGAALVLEIWRADLIGEGLRVARGHELGGGACGLISSSSRIVDELRIGGRESVRAGLAHWGVSVPESMRGPIDTSRGVALSVLAEGRDAGEIRSLLEGVRRASRRVENLLVFLDSPAAERSAVWRAARKLGLLGILTTVAGMEERREPILQTDMLALPEPRGVCRTLPLAAMAEGVSILARPDPYHETWLNAGTARLVGSVGRGAPGPEQWEAAIIACVERVEETAGLRQAARAMVRQQRSLAAYVEAVKQLHTEVAGKSETTVAAGAPATAGGTMGGVVGGAGPASRG